MELGRYRHYKNIEVEVIGSAKHSETLEEMVVYRHLDTKELWVRPKIMFEETVEYQGRKVPRFAFIK